MSYAETLSLQDRYAPRNFCFGCGPANEKGLPTVRNNTEDRRLSERRSSSGDGRSL